MPEQLWRVRGLDPLLFRDGKPFSAEKSGLSASSMLLPMPGTLAGCVRTRVGNLSGRDWSRPGKGAVSVAGPLLTYNADVQFSVPADALIYQDDNHNRHVICLRPAAIGAGEGCDLPGRNLVPLEITEDVKPERGNLLWSAADTFRWMAHGHEPGFEAPPASGGLPVDERVHVGIKQDTGCSDDGMLFTTTSTGFEDYHKILDYKIGAQLDSDTGYAFWELLVRVGDSTDLKGVQPFGGERRLAVFTPAQGTEWPAMPLNVANELRDATRVRMQLATPAIFARGWKPSWLDANMQGTPPGCDGLTLQLVSAAALRREPVSGWDFREGKSSPKRLRFTVPAGSVYFFEVITGSAEALVSLWLQPVSDSPFDRNDGYGLALWSAWQHTN